MACYLHGGGCGAGRRGGGVSHRNIGDGEELLFAETQEEAQVSRPGGAVVRARQRHNKVSIQDKRSCDWSSSHTTQQVRGKVRNVFAVRKTFKLHRGGRRLSGNSFALIQKASSALKVLSHQWEQVTM